MTLGNLSVKEIAERLEIALTNDEMEFLDYRRQVIASNIKPGKWLRVISKIKWWGNK